MMLNPDGAHAIKEQHLMPPSEPVVVETRFGDYEFTPDNTVIMPSGLIGFPDHRIFGIANLPEPVPQDFKLLQSLGELPISLIVMPSSPEQAPIEPSDLDEACAASGLKPSKVHLLFVCTLREKENGEGIEMSINLRAPIILNLAERTARQHVFQNDRYSTRHALDKWDGSL